MQTIYQTIRSRLNAFYASEELTALSRIICRDLLQLSITDLYSCKDIKLSPTQQKKLEEILGRLTNHEPIQYITGATEFMGLTFNTCPGALIPRPETEELVSHLLKSNLPAQAEILDIGTGTGCIAISLAHYIPQARVEAWDISEEALRIAAGNNIKAGTSVVFRKVDILDNPPADNRYDLIVSNPPYVTQREKKEMAPRVLEWEPPTALFVPDDDPLIFYRKIINFGLIALKEKGMLCFELNPHYAKQLEDLLEKSGMHTIELRKDIFNRNRFITARR